MQELLYFLSFMRFFKIALQFLFALISEPLHYPYRRDKQPSQILKMYIFLRFVFYRRPFRITKKRDGPQSKSISIIQ